MSRASRRRLMYKLGTIRREVTPWFVTLTYPGEFVGDERTCKRDLDRFAHRLQRIGSAAVWRLEFKIRRTGASQGEAVPHFHLLVWRHDSMQLEEFQHWLSRAWFHVVGSHSLDHLAAGTQCELIRSWHGVMSYAAKYIMKEDTSILPKGVGRLWGIVNRDAIPWASPQVVTLSRWQFVTAFQHCVTYVGKDIWRDQCPTRTVLCDSPGRFLQEVQILARRARGLSVRSPQRADAPFSVSLDV